MKTCVIARPSDNRCHVIATCSVRVHYAALGNNMNIEMIALSEQLDNVCDVKITARLTLNIAGGTRNFIKYIRITCS